MHVFFNGLVSDLYGQTCTLYTLIRAKLAKSCTAEKISSEGLLLQQTEIIFLSKVYVNSSKSCFTYWTLNFRKMRKPNLFIQTYANFYVAIGRLGAVFLGLVIGIMGGLEYIKYVYCIVQNHNALYS